MSGAKVTMTSPFTPIQKDKLLLSLLQDDILNGLNTALKVRKATLILDYRSKVPSLQVQMPGLSPEVLIWLDVRKRISYVLTPRHPDYQALVNDLGTRLNGHGARLHMASNSPPNAKKQALVQIHVDGARNFGLTLMKAQRGELLKDTHFEPAGSDKE